MVNNNLNFERWKGGEGLILSLILFFFVGPTCLLFHEIGHGLGVIATSKSRVHIYLGMRAKNNKENIRLGRLHFHIQSSFTGFTYWKEGLGKRQSAIALVGGPLMSLVLAILFTSLSLLVSQGVVQQFASWTAIFTFIQFLGTIIPLTYPGWMGGYSGFPSDGLQLIRIVKKIKKES